jgi:hypothetical protein
MIHMTDKDLDAFLEHLTQSGWRVGTKDTPLFLNESVRKRYPRLPEEYEAFLSLVDDVVAPDEQSWFWCEADFREDSKPEHWAWDAFEKLSLGFFAPEYAPDDPKELELIKEFWDQHIPIAFSPRGDYAFLAIKVAGDDYGGIYYACDDEYYRYFPDLDSGPKRVCGSFGDLIGMIREALERGVSEDTPQEILDFIGWPTDKPTPEGTTQARW